MPSNPPVRLSGPLGWMLAAALAALCFAAGLLTARAFWTESDAPASSQSPGGPAASSPPSVGGATRPGLGRPGMPTPAGFGGGTAPGSEDTAKPGYGYPYQCQAPLPVDTLGPASIDLQAAGIQPRTPRTGFDLLSVGLSTTVDCDESGRPLGPVRPVLTSSWRQSATGLDLFLTQYPTDEPVPPFLRQDSADFAALGYRFSIYVNGYSARPLDAGMPYPGGPDPRAAEVLREAIRQVVPGFDQKCFWVAAEGSWADLAAVGVGDPRPAIPPGMTPGEIHITAFREPAPGCDTSVRPVEGFGFYASWFSPRGETLGISVTGLPPGTPSEVPGYVDQFGANWSSGSLMFSVWYSSPDGSGKPDLVRAVARALDPGYDPRCFIQQRTLTEAELARLGLRAPAPPAGYTVARASLLVSDIPAGCPRPAGFTASYTLFWTLERGADVIDVSVYPSPGSTAGGQFSGWIGDNTISWTRPDGTSFNVSGYSKGINPVVPRDDLVAVAKSLDPTLDIEKLEKQPGAGAVPPRPAPDAPQKPN